MKKVVRPKAVVAGGAGFLGYHMTRRLLGEGYDVYVVDNYETGTRRVEPYREPRFF